MTPTAREIAEAFSRHDFEQAFPHLAETVVWIMPGSDAVEGREAVVEACTATAAALAGTQIDTERFVVVDGGDSVAVDTLTSYRDGDGLSRVSSCDIYEFRNGKVMRITSYTVEV